MDLADPGADQTVARHRVEDAALAEQHHQHHRAEAEHRADGDREDGASSSCVMLLASRSATGCGTLSSVVRHHAGEHERDEDVEHGADRRASRGCRSACRAADSSPPAPPCSPRRSRCRRRRPARRPGARRSSRTRRRSPVLGGMNGCQLAGVDVAEAPNDDEQDDDRDLEDHDQVVDVRRLLDADDQDRGRRGARSPSPAG